MAPEEGWHELKTADRRECPKLFYNCWTADSAFNLLVTDLIGLWRCSLDKNEINAEAVRQHCPIDPSTSPQQLNVLLSKLKLAVHEGENRLAQEGSKRSQSLLLATSIPLPKPLRPLEWTFQLAPQNASEMGEHILKPCLHQITVSKHKLDSLNRVIKDKDHVISKLLDRIGNSAVDLSLIFPGITGLASRKGHITVSEAMKHVPGMAPFDSKAWADQLGATSLDDGGDERGLGNLALGYEKCFHHAKSEHEDWMSTLPGPGGLKSRREPARKEKVSEKESTPKPQPDSDNESTASEDDFERQATPPSVKKRDEALNKKSSPSLSPQLQQKTSPSQSRTRAKLGKIGGIRRSRATEHQTNPAASSPTKPERSSSSPDDHKSNISISSGSKSEIGSDPAPQTRSSTKRDKPSKLGKLGPRSKTSASPASRRSKSPPAPRPKSPSPSTTHHKLGRLETRNPKRGAASQDRLAGTSNHPTSRPKRLGRIGVSKEQTDESSHQSDSASPNTETPAARTRAKTEKDDNVDGGDDSDATASTTTSGSPVAAKKPKPDGGGQSATPKSDIKSTAPLSSSAPATNRTTLEKKDQAASEEDETAEQRANRRRDELKRTLNTGGGAKKKRRF